MAAPLNHRHFPDNACFGCGPANPAGLRIEIVEEGDLLVTDVAFDEHHQGPSGIVNGGMVSVPMDCLSTWVAMRAFGKRGGDDAPQPAVTAEYRMRLLRPTPVGEQVHIAGRADEMTARRARVTTTATVGGETTARFEGVFVAVPERA